MTARKQRDNDDGMPISKKPRIGGSQDERIAAPSDTVTFGSLPTDCKVLIFKGLTEDEMNTMSEVNKDCYQVRANESLPQEKTGTIVILERQDRRSADVKRATLPVCEKLEEVQEAFTGNRTRMKLVGVGNIKDSFMYGDENRSRPMEILGRVRFETVTSLDCSSPHRVDGNGLVFELLARNFPNLLHVNLSGLRFRHEYFIRSSPFRLTFPPSIQSITWNQPFNAFSLDGGDLSQATHLTSFFADGLMFVQEHHYYPETKQREFYMFMKCSRLERLSILGATVTVNNYHNHHPLPQEHLVRMVRRHPNLRWLRSDLTAENVAMLKEERPEITFL